MMVYIVTKYNDSSFSQSEIKVGGNFPPHQETSSKKSTQNKNDIVFAKDCETGGILTSNASPTLAKHLLNLFAIIILLQIFSLLVMIYIFYFVLILIFLLVL